MFVVDDKVCPRCKTPGIPAGATKCPHCQASIGVLSVWLPWIALIVVVGFGLLVGAMLLAA